MKKAKAIFSKFKVNEYITLQLEDGIDGMETVIYIEGIPFKQCKFLLLNIPVDKIKSFDDIDSIDEAAERLDRSMEGDGIYPYEIPPETEFWAHCSNLQVWAESNYNTRLLKSDLAFPLLKKLTEAGDPLANKVFREEIAKRFENGHNQVQEYLLEEGYMSYLSEEELSSLTPKQYSDFVIIKGKLYPIDLDYYELWVKGEETGKLKDIDEIKGLKRQTDLKHLLIEGHNIEEIKGLETLRRLEELNLAKNQIIDIKSLEKLTNLKNLILSSNKITEIKGLELLINLKELYLYDNEITEIKRLETLKNLELLSLGKNQITEIKGLENLTNLKELWLNNNQIYEIKGLQTLKKLEKLVIGGNHVPKDLLERLGGLKEGMANDPQKFVEFCHQMINKD